MDDEVAIKEIIEAYFRGTYHGDETQLRQAFHPEARITGIFNGVYCDWSLNEFIDRVIAKPTAASKKDLYQKEIVYLDQTQDAAIVRAKVLVAGISFTDYITLLK